ncbi:MAG: SDR family NAD(P)-dependent oxidoreductase [Candidatus Bathyarchaeia archaeon]
MRFLVTGGAGFIGSNIARKLLSDGYKVVVLDDMSLGKSKNTPPGAVVVNGDVRDAQTVEEAVREVDGIFHNAARSSSPMFYPDPREGFDVNLKGFMNVVEAARRRDIPVVYASTSSLYSRCEPPHREDMEVRPGSFYECSFYAREKAASLYAELYGLRLVGLRYFSVYGPGEEHKGRFANNISQFIWEIMGGRSPVIYGDGTQTRDFIFVEDVVEANILAMKSNLKGEVFNVGTGVATSFNDLVNIINEVLGTSIRPVYVQNPIKNYVKHTRADTRKATEVLGFKAKVGLRDGIKKTAEYYKKKGINFGSREP